MITITSYNTHQAVNILEKLSEQNSSKRSNAGIRVFFSKNKLQINETILFTSELKTIIDNS